MRVAAYSMVASAGGKRLVGVQERSAAEGGGDLIAIDSIQNLV
jgi:hypothetical protein